MCRLLAELTACQICGQRTVAQYRTVIRCSLGYENDRLCPYVWESIGNMGQYNRTCTLCIARRTGIGLNPNLSHRPAPPRQQPSQPSQPSEPPRSSLGLSRAQMLETRPARRPPPRAWPAGRPPVPPWPTEDARPSSTTPGARPSRTEADREQTPRPSIEPPRTPADRELTPHFVAEPSRPTADQQWTPRPSIWPSRTTTADPERTPRPSDPNRTPRAAAGPSRSPGEDTEMSDLSSEDSGGYEEFRARALARTFVFVVNGMSIRDSNRIVSAWLRRAATSLNDREATSANVIEQAQQNNEPLLTQGFDPRLVQDLGQPPENMYLVPAVDVENYQIFSPYHVSPTPPPAILPTSAPRGDERGSPSTRRTNPSATTPAVSSPQAEPFSPELAWATLDALSGKSTLKTPSVHATLKRGYVTSSESSEDDDPSGKGKAKAKPKAIKSHSSKPGGSHKHPRKDGGGDDEGAVQPIWAR